MTTLPALTGKQLIAALARVGFKVQRTKGSHYFLRHADGRTTVVPSHGNDTIGTGLLAKILRDCELTRDELRQVL